MARCGSSAPRAARPRGTNPGGGASGAAAGPLQRQALHAFRLAFAHPVTGQALEFHAPLPQDMAQALDFWALQYNAR